MSNIDVMKEMLSLAKAIVLHYDKAEAMEVLEGLDKWIVGDVTVTELRRIAINGVVSRNPLDTSYDSEITANLTNIYANAAARGQYNISLVESAIKSNRSYKVVEKLAKFDRASDGHIDVETYVLNSQWSDDWVEHILRNYSNINKSCRVGYSIMDVFSPEHNPNVFDTVCYRLVDDNVRVIIPINWIKDTNYSLYTVSNLIDLYHENPYFDWAGMITPDISGFAIQEITQATDKDLSKDDIKKILDYWSNVTPKLEYTIMDGNQGISLQRKKEIYERCKARYGCDGDELANELFDGKYPARVVKDNEYWHSVHDTGGTNQFLSALRAMQGGM